MHLTITRKTYLYHQLQVTQSVTQLSNKPTYFRSIYHEQSECINMITNKANFHLQSILNQWQPSVKSACYTTYIHPILEYICFSYLVSQPSWRYKQNQNSPVSCCEICIHNNFNRTASVTKMLSWPTLQLRRNQAELRRNQAELRRNQIKLKICFTKLYILQEVILILDAMYHWTAECEYSHLEPPGITWDIYSWQVRKKHISVYVQPFQLDIHLTLNVYAILNFEFCASQINKLIESLGIIVTLWIEWIKCLIALCLQS